MRQDKLIRDCASRLTPMILTPLVLVSLLTLSAAIVMQQLWLDWHMGGQAWRQGDWLIHTFGGNIRRGAFGTALLYSADTFGISALNLLIGLQASLVSCIYLLLLKALWSFRTTTLPLLLIASPGMLVFFWAGDVEGSLRKEMLVFIALLLALPPHKQMGQSKPTGTLLLSSLIFCAAVWAHEAMALFLPLFLGLLWMNWRAVIEVQTRQQSERNQHQPTAFPPHILKGACIIACALICASCSTLAVTYALRHITFIEPEQICAPLLQRGFLPHICEGAISYLHRSHPEAAAQIHERLTNAPLLWHVPALYICSLLPFLYTAALSHRPKTWIALVLLSGLPFTLLFPVSLDWGRWVLFHCVSAFCLLLAGLRMGILTQRRAPNLPLLCLLLLTSGTLGLPHFDIGVDLGGAFKHMRTLFEAL